MSRKINKTILDKNKCTDKCSNDDTDKYEYNNTCYDKCPNDTYLLEDNDNLICYNKPPSGYYLDSINQTFKKCYETCNKCNIGGNETLNNCIECKFHYHFYNNSMNITNCYKICENYYYFDKENKYHCTENSICPEEYNKLIINKSKCIDECKKDDTFKYEYNNICYQECPKELIQDEINYICYNNKNIETSFINIETSFINIETNFINIETKEAINAKMDNFIIFSMLLKMQLKI